VFLAESKHEPPLPVDRDPETVLTADRVHEKIGTKTFTDKTALQRVQIANPIDRCRAAFRKQNGRSVDV
jgi:hypothetical protein